MHATIAIIVAVRSRYILEESAARMPAPFACVFCSVATLHGMFVEVEVFTDDYMLSPATRSGKRNKINAWI